MDARRVCVLVLKAANRGGDEEQADDGGAAKHQDRFTASSFRRLAEFWWCCRVNRDPVEDKQVLLPLPNESQPLVLPHSTLLSYALTDSGAVLGKRSSARLNSMPAFPSLDGATTEDDLAMTEIDSGVCFTGVGSVDSSFGVATFKAERLLSGAARLSGVTAPGGGVLGPGEGATVLRTVVHGG